MWLQPLAAKTPRERSVGLIEDPLGEQLKSYFDAMTSGPTPDCLLRLTEALETAFERGELQCSPRRSSRG